MHKFDQEDKKAAMSDNIRRIAKELGQTPTITEFKRKRRATDFSYEQIRRTFGTWTAAVEAAGLEANPINEPPSNKIERRTLIDEFVRVANKLGKLPSHPVFSANSSISPAPFDREFGSWRKAVHTIVTEARGRFTFDAKILSETSENKSFGRSRPLGLSTPLLFVPRNETETLVLFALLASELGYEIEAAQISFPDLVLRQNGERIRAEVEFLSSTYLAHGHPISADILCVCWRRDIDIPGLREILSLEEVVRSMPNNGLQHTPASGRR